MYKQGQEGELCTTDEGLDYAENVKDEDEECQGEHTYDGYLLPSPGFKFAQQYHRDEYD